MNKPGVFWEELLAVLQMLIYQFQNNKDGSGAPQPFACNYFLLVNSQQETYIIRK